MKTILTKKIISKFSNLKPYQQKKIVKFLNKYLAINIIDTDFITGKEMVCKDCGSNFFVKNGTYKRKIDKKKVQRFLCQKCRNTQFTDVNTPLYNLKEKNKWVDFVYLMLDKEEPMRCDSISKAM